MPPKLPPTFYLDHEVVMLAKALLGKVLVTQIGGIRTSGIITETEAYQGPEDRASHAYGGRRTARTETMYLPGGHSYIYLCYGIHHLFNVVTGPAELPHAVLVRAIEPVEGLELMLQRRGMLVPGPRLATGPGSMSKALGLTTSLDGAPLTGSVVWIEDRGIVLPGEKIKAGPRIGVDYAGPDAGLPWRFWIE
jgi:DNA-3-methyladenine glycosylase